MHMEYALSNLIVIYFFLSGTAAGAFFISSILGYYPRYKKVCLAGCLVSFFLIAAGSLFLILDLGHPFRFWRLFFLPGINPLSAVAWGSVIIPIFMGLNLLNIFWVSKEHFSLVRKFSLINIIMSFLLGSYTGYLISACKSFPLWHSAIMPPLFFVSGLMSALAVIVLISNIFHIFPEGDKLKDWMRYALIYLILIDAFLLTDYYILYMGFSEAREIANLILFGQFAPLFWKVEVLFGIIFPLLLLLSKWKNNLIIQSIASISVVTGVFVMRYIIVIAGQHFVVH